MLLHFISYCETNTLNIQNLRLNNNDLRQEELESFSTSPPDCYLGDFLFPWKMQEICTALLGQCVLDSLSENNIYIRDYLELAARGNTPFQVLLGVTGTL